MPGFSRTSTAIALTRRGRHALVLIAFAAVLAFASSAQGQTTSAYNEPGYTKGNQNTYVYAWNSTAAAGDQFWLCFDTQQNGVTVESSNGGGGPGAQNCTGNINFSGSRSCTNPSPPPCNGTAGDFGVQPFEASTILADGSLYQMCVSAYRKFGGLNSFISGSSSCNASRIDRNQPSVIAAVNGEAEYTNNPSLDFTIHYTDSTSPPWPANYVCIRVGVNDCDPATSYAYNPDCSALNLPYNDARVRDFHCIGDASSAPDGPVHFCAGASDSAIPDNPTSTNQFVYSGTSTAVHSGTANISQASCGYVTLDRTPPQVGAAANATTVTAGDLVTFTASSNDATSGVSGNYTWIFGDNTANGSGSSATHTYTQPGTYEAKATTTDGAGNTGEGTQTITVQPLSTGGGGNTVPGGTSSGGTISQTPPSNNQISQQVGGGGTQTQNVGGLGIIAPKKAKITKRLRNLPVALNASQPGKVDLALVRRGRIVSQAAAVLGEAGTFGLRMRLPRRLKPGTYQLRVTFTPMGSTDGTTKTLRIKFTKKKKARGSSARAFRGVPNVTDGPRHDAKPPKRSRPIVIR